VVAEVVLLVVVVVVVVGVVEVVMLIRVVVLVGRGDSGRAGLSVAVSLMVVMVLLLVGHGPCLRPVAVVSCSVVCCAGVLRVFVLLALRFAVVCLVLSRSASAAALPVALPLLPAPLPPLLLLPPASAAVFVSLSRSVVLCRLSVGFTSSANRADGSSANGDRSACAKPGA